MPNKIRAIYYSVTLVAFIIGAFFVITYATGYKIDITNRNISQTGMIVVEADDQDRVTLNGELVGSGKITLRDLKPENYEVKVTREGYYDWARSLELTPGEAEIINDIILFKNNKQVSEYKLTETDITKLSDTDGLTSANNEIYQNGSFVTRFANPVSGVSWYADRRYISYTYQDKLHIIEIDGTNDVTLLDKKSSTPVVFLNSGRSVIYENDGKIYRAEIR